MSQLPESAQRYLRHAIAPGTPLASTVRLRMHGEIKLKRWLRFTAEQSITAPGEMIWRATVRMHGLPIRGFDRLMNNEGAMRWKLLGIIPMMTASGPDITRSAIGRVAAESVWLPSMLCGDGARWTGSDSRHPHATLSIQGQATELTLTIDNSGALSAVQLSRWGNPGGGEFHYASFGGVVEEQGTFGGYTIPTRLRVGWYFGTERFERDGEFFRVKIDEATYR
jgi:hypothetical protein